MSESLKIFSEIFVSAFNLFFLVGAYFYSKGRNERQCFFFSFVLGGFFIFFGNFFEFELYWFVMYPLVFAFLYMFHKKFMGKDGKGNMLLLTGREILSLFKKKKQAHIDQGELTSKRRVDKAEGRNPP
jgi:hypothetical protein